MLRVSNGGIALANLGLFDHLVDEAVDHVNKCRFCYPYVEAIRLASREET
jgi:hypothetical protein